MSLPPLQSPDGLPFMPGQAAAIQPLLHHLWEQRLEGGRSKVKYHSRPQQDPWASCVPSSLSHRDGAMPSPQAVVGNGAKRHGLGAFRRAWHLVGPQGPFAQGPDLSVPRHVWSQECSQGLSLLVLRASPRVAGCTRQVPVVITTHWLSAAWARGPGGCWRLCWQPGPASLLQPGLPVSALEPCLVLLRVSPFQSPTVRHGLCWACTRLVAGIFTQPRGVGQL